MASSVLPSHRHGRALVGPSILRHWLRIAAFGPFFLFASLLRLPFWLRFWLNKPRLAANYVNEGQLDPEEEFARILHRIGNVGQRSTGSKAHADLVDWFEAELQQIPGLELRSEEIELLGWQANGSLHDAGKLMVGDLQDDDSDEPVPIPGVIPYSFPTTGQPGRLRYVPPQTPLSSLTADDLRGKVILATFLLSGSTNGPDSLISPSTKIFLKPVDWVRRLAERVVYITHTDGNTFVQENGGAALLTLARYFTKLPLASRRRTIEFSFNAGHLHISREGSLRQAQQMSDTFDTNNTVLVIPVEHLGTREMQAVDNYDDKQDLEGGIDNGRQLYFTGRGELMFWCTSPSMVVVQAVREAIVRHQLDRVLSTRGISFPNMRSVPMFTSFGGIGTYYRNLLVPTTSLISGPWSLCAPSFGTEAVDVRRLRQQTLAIGDIFMAIDLLSKKGYCGWLRKVARAGCQHHRRHNGCHRDSSRASIRYECHCAYFWCSPILSILIEVARSTK
ncbi:hypothetical protein Sste5346_007272 [Sporothrix stenoceras]|uniref:Uncharacterized protein n=1 Tax=Sporothrix stenoceras TaxID=5173 RepID=A0ABR3YW34_9PEZI